MRKWVCGRKPNKSLGGDYYMIVEAVKCNWCNIESVMFHDNNNCPNCGKPGYLETVISEVELEAVGSLADSRIYVYHNDENIMTIANVPDSVSVSHDEGGIMEWVMENHGVTLFNVVRATKEEN
jgi:hypothetical protein